MVQHSCQTKYEIGNNHPRIYKMKSRYCFLAPLITLVATTAYGQVNKAFHALNISKVRHRNKVQETKMKASRIGTATLTGVMAMGILVSSLAADDPTEPRGGKPANGSQPSAK